MLGPARFSHIETCASEVCQEFKRSEGIRECISTLTTLDAVLAGLRAEYGDTAEPKNQSRTTSSEPPKAETPLSKDYPNLDLAKGKRLIKARENAIKSVQLLLTKRREAMAANLGRSPMNSFS